MGGCVRDGGVVCDCRTGNRRGGSAARSESGCECGLRVIIAVMREWVALRSSAGQRSAVRLLCGGNVGKLATWAIAAHHSPRSPARDLAQESARQSGRRRPKLVATHDDEERNSSDA